MNDAALILFTLSPEAEGARKRLGGQARTRDIFAALIDHLGGVCDEVQGLDLLVASPRPTALPSATYLPQRGTSFGDSLRLAVDDAFALGYSQVLLVGNDAPEITGGYLRQALENLRRNPSDGAVLGPARDGGYALLGLSGPCPAAFQGIRFGTPGVASTTEQRLRDEGLRVVRLATLEDIDDLSSLHSVLGRLSNRASASSCGDHNAFAYDGLLRRLQRLLAPDAHGDSPSRRAPDSGQSTRIFERGPPRAA